jgi:hypothetical protein
VVEAVEAPSIEAEMGGSLRAEEKLARRCVGRCRVHETAVGEQNLVKRGAGV